MILAASLPSYADLQDDVTLLTRNLKNKKTYHLGPRILEQSDELPLLVPNILIRSDPNACLHLVALAGQSVQFVLGVPSNDEAEDDTTLASRAGLIEHVRCGQDQGSLADATLTMASPRGVVEIISFSDNNPTATAVLVLPWRAAGDEAPEHSLNHWAAAPNLIGANRPFGTTCGLSGGGSYGATKRSR